MNDLVLWLALYGRKIGYFILSIVSFWDLLIMGARGFLEWRVAPLGILGIWLGLALMVISFKCEKSVGGR